jgi:hypothetical protein
MRAQPQPPNLTLDSLHVQPQLTLGLFLFSVGIGRWNTALSVFGLLHSSRRFVVIATNP